MGVLLTDLTFLAVDDELAVLPLREPPAPLYCLVLRAERIALAPIHFERPTVSTRYYVNITHAATPTQPRFPYSGSTGSGVRVARPSGVQHRGVLAAGGETVGAVNEQRVAGVGVPATVDAVDAAAEQPPPLRRAAGCCPRYDHPNGADSYPAREGLAPLVPRPASRGLESLAARRAKLDDQMREAVRELRDRDASVIELADGPQRLEAVGLQLVEAVRGQLAFRFAMQEAHAAVARALKEGRLQRPEVCEGCGKPPRELQKLHGHHEDYSKPLEVVRLCAGCHTKRHPRGEMAQTDTTRGATRWPPVLKCIDEGAR